MLLMCAKCDKKQLIFIDRQTSNLNMQHRQPKPLPVVLSLKQSRLPHRNIPTFPLMLCLKFVG